MAVRKIELIIRFDDAREPRFDNTSSQSNPQWNCGLPDYHQKHNAYQVGNFSLSFDSPSTSEYNHEDVHQNVSLCIPKQQEPGKSLSSSSSSPTPDPGNDNFRGNLLKERYNLVQELMRYQTFQTKDSDETTSTPLRSPVSPLNTANFEEEEDDDISTVPNAAYKGFRQPHHRADPLTTPNMNPTQRVKSKQFSGSVDDTHHLQKGERQTENFRASFHP